MPPRPDPPGRDADDEVDNPVEQLKLLSADDEQLARYLDSLELTGPREREMLSEIARTQPLARPERFPADHRNIVEALESLARHGYRGSGAGRRAGPLRAVVRFGVQLVARYLVVSHIRNFSTKLRNLYVLREAASVPGTQERLELRRARMEAERMVAALEERELGVPTFLIGGAALPVAASLGRITGVFEEPLYAGVLGVVGLAIALLASWFVLRGAALASRRIRLATHAATRELWTSIGWCGDPPRAQVRTFVIVAVSLTLGAWIVVPVLVGLAIAS